MTNIYKWLYYIYSVWRYLTSRVGYDPWFVPGHSDLYIYNQSSEKKTS